MSYPTGKRERQQQAQSSTREPSTSRAVAPGKQTLTMRLPARSGSAPAPVQRRRDAAAGPPAAERATRTMQWLDTAMRPDLHAPPVQRKGTGEDAAEAQAPTGSGQPLPGDVQAKMSRSFGADFSGVRVHQGAHATSLGALAYTQGTDIHFAPGQYDPHSGRGQELLGHELTHVVQQSQGRVRPTMQAKGAAINDDASLEHEADVMGAKAARGEPVSDAPGGAPGGAIGDAGHEVSGDAGGAHERGYMQLKSAGQVIQREVGFEIETTAASGLPENATPLSAPEKAAIPLDCGGAAGWNRPNVVDGRVMPVPKGTPLLVKGRFELQADERSNGSSDVEFVIPPAPPCFPETAEGRNDLKATMTSVVQVANALGANRCLSLAEVAQAAGGYAPLPNAVIAGGLGLLGLPQTTAALRLDQLPRFLEDNGPAPGPNGWMDVDDGRGDLMLSNPALNAEYIDVAGAPGLARAGVGAYHANAQAQIAEFNADNNENVLAGGQGSNELIGLMSLLVSYLRKADATAEGGPGVAAELHYPKALAAIMARTDMATMFGLLPPGERDYFTTYPMGWANMVFQASGAGGAVTDPLFRRGVLGAGGVADATFQSLTRSDWLVGIVAGQDLLTRASFPSGPGGAPDQPFNNQYIDGSLGGLGAHTEQVGTGHNVTQAPIVELRRMRQNIPVDQWRSFMIDVFDYIRALNAGQNRQYRRRKQYDATDVMTRH